MMIRDYDCNVYPQPCGVRSVVTAKNVKTEMWNSIECFSKDEELALNFCIQEIHYNYLNCGGKQ